MYFNSDFAKRQPAAQSLARGFAGHMQKRGKLSSYFDTRFARSKNYFYTFLQNNYSSVYPWSTSGFNPSYLCENDIFQ